MTFIPFTPPLNWRTYVMVICGLLAVLLDVLPPQMLVPITPEWLGWCEDTEPSESTVIITTTQTSQSPNTTFSFQESPNTTSRFQESPNTTSSFLDVNQSAFETFTQNDINDTTYDINDTTYDINDTTSEVIFTPLDNDSCTRQDFDPRISLVYLAAGPVEVIASPFVAFLCDRIGSNSLLLLSLIATAIIDIPFAYGSGFLTYLIVRVLINISTTVTEVSYLHMIGQLFANDDTTRARFLGLYSTVLGFDYFGPTFSGVLYHLFGQAMPFLTLLVVGIITALVFFIVGLNCKISRNINLDDKLEEVKPLDISYTTLVKDPYVLIVFVAVFLIILPKAMIAPFISIWLRDEFQTTAWITGVIYFPGFIAYILSNIIAERLLTKFQKYAWLFGAISLALDGICVMILPFSPNIISFSVIFAFQVALATFAGFIIFPMFLKIADNRYGVPTSSSVHGFSFISVALAYFIGPMLSSGLFMEIGFKSMNLVVGGLHILVAPLILFMKIICYRKEINEETYLVSVTSRESIHDTQEYD